MDFSDTRERIAAMPVRFWAGVPKVPAKKKESMAIYTLFIQHVLNSLKSTGKGAIVVPTGFVTAKSGVEKKILQHIVDEHIVYGCISMPSNVFANTGTNVSVLFFDNSRKTDKVVLIDASKLGEEMCIRDRTTEQKNNITYVLNGTTQIQSYVKQLIDVTKSWNCSDVTYTTVRLEDFFADIKEQALGLVEIYHQKIDWKAGQSDKKVTIAYDPMFRVVMNMIQNAVEHLSLIHI